MGIRRVCRTSTPKRCALASLAGLLLSLSLGCGGGKGAPPATTSQAIPSGSAAGPSTPATVASSASTRAADEAKHQLSLNLDARFVLRERSGNSVIIAEEGKKRLLEVHKLEGAGCTADLVPRIGPVTSLAAGDKTKHRDLELQWFTQRSSVEQMPFGGLGFFICSHRSFLVVRYVGPEESLGDARPSLERLIAERSIVIE